MVFPKLLATVLASLCLSRVLAEFEHLDPRKERDHFNCATPARHKDSAAIRGVATRDPFSSYSLNRSSSNSSEVPPIPVKAWFHVVAENTTLAGGYISDEKIAAQMQTLNGDFAPSFRFELEGVTRTLNLNWSEALERSEAETEMKSALRTGDYKTLNIYTQKRVGPITGYAHFPERVVEGSLEWNVSGVVVHYDTLPGGVNPWFNLGKILVHEVGHWLDLIHTFGLDEEGSTCTGLGDFIADTPAEFESNSECIFGRDTCPDQEGLDPITNHMDYSYDACKFEFTPLQRKRMIDTWYTYYESPSY
ncbi:metalloprotease MEP1-like protein [Leptodontidium sp. MPI-SDFR-AT-0119]|nr:metalloprotease MEP1-like protein [Leptodontidium sp. MPI-SDFR-AT-0119]